ncbi:MAG: lytic transglycosylase domain-containing protein [Alphaproteobacteria bacterium]|nr:lytic transglycosylase domain-containing protein [Alphaproteobacteria bacterium]
MKMIWLRWSLQSFIFLGLAMPCHGSSPLLQKYTTWKKLTTEQNVSRAELVSFVQKNPSWPLQDTLLKKIEETFTKMDTAQARLSWFDQNPPVTAEGAFLYAEALLTTNQLTKATEFVRKTWVSQDLSSNASTFREKFSDLITEKEDQDRLNRLLCTEKIAAAQSMFRWVNQSEQDIAKTRIELIQEKPTASKRLTETLVFAKDHAGLLYDQIKWNRRQKNNDVAKTLLLKGSPQENDFPEEWWTERNMLARRFIEEKRFSDALSVIQKHCLRQGENYINAEWMIGWLQLRFLKQPQKALERFQSMHNTVKSQMSKARAAFWAGEASKVLGLIDQATQWYQKSGERPATYYGQLALSRLNAAGGKKCPSIMSKPIFSKESKARFESYELVKVIRLLPKNENQQFVVPLYTKLSKEIQDPEEQVLLGELASQSGLGHLAVCFYRNIRNDQRITTPYAFPVLPKLVSQTIIPKIARGNSNLLYLAHAIIRQESEFNANAQDSLGAKGLMQLMPQTAIELERKVPIKGSLYSVEKNVTLGTTYIKDLLDDFGNNLILAIAAYNAGPKAVNEWISVFGDPRDGKIDAVDWVELIPYHVTRNYVQRVLENFMVYKERLKSKAVSSCDLAQHLKINH